jgi:hypothetical protein
MNLSFTIFFLFISLAASGVRAREATTANSKTTATQGDKADEDKGMAPEDEPVEWVTSHSAEEQGVHKRSKTLDFEGTTIEGVDRRQFDAFNEFSDNTDMDGAGKSHYYGMRGSFQDEIELTVGELLESY